MRCYKIMQKTKELCDRDLFQKLLIVWWGDQYSQQ